MWTFSLLYLITVARQSYTVEVLRNECMSRKFIILLEKLFKLTYYFINKY